MKARINETTRLFLNYYFKGDGRYYLTEYGSRNFRNTMFANFIRLNPGCVTITGSGNDAPRGGKVGEYVDVTFTPAFFEAFGWFFEEKKRVEESAQNRAKKLAILHDSQLEAWRFMLADNPERKARYQHKVNTSPSNSSRSGNWRNWLRRKAAKHVAAGVFNDLALSAPELRDILFEN